MSGFFLHHPTTKTPNLDLLGLATNNVGIKQGRKFRIVVHDNALKKNKIKTTKLLTQVGKQWTFPLVGISEKSC